jgi:hypothetical protein
MNGKKSFPSPFTLPDKPVILVTVQIQARAFSAQNFFRRGAASCKRQVQAGTPPFIQLTGNHTGQGVPGGIVENQNGFIDFHGKPDGFFNADGFLPLSVFCPKGNPVDCTVARQGWFGKATPFFRSSP